MSTSTIVAGQNKLWYAIPLLPSFIIYFVSAVGESNRTPFDLPEGESELTGGYLTEYSSFKFAMFYLAEYIAMITISALCVTLFLGGWRAPWPLSQLSWANTGWVPLVWFLAKTIILMGVFVWLRGTLPRVRYDQLMALGWKVLMPINLVWILMLAAARVWLGQRDMMRYLWLAGPVAFVILVLVLWPSKEKEKPGEQGRSKADLGVGGFPVPPIDLVVPPNPRLKRVEAQRASEPVDATAGTAGKEG
jgi:NADH-quinone oxidoreductase subunit H